MTDKFATFQTALDSPITRTCSITPSDTANLPDFVRGINLATDGTVRVTGADDPDGTYTDLYLLAGVWHQGRYKRIWATGTTATSIKGGW